MAEPRKTRTVRLNDAEAAQLDELCRARGRKRGEVLRSLVLEEHRRLVLGLTTEQVQLVDEHDLHELLSAAAREGNISAMRELRFLLSKPTGDAGGRRDRNDDREGPATDGFDALDELEQARRRKKRTA